MWANIKKFDFHSKALEGLQSKSIFGGLITVVSGILIFALFVLEVREYNNIHELTNLNVDTTVDSRSHAKFNITLLNMKCNEVDLDFENFKVRSPEDIKIQKFPYKPENLRSVFDQFLPEQIPACRLEAEFDIFNGQGSFHIPIHSGKINYGNDFHTHTYDRNTLETYNSSHIINNLYFGSYIPTMNYPLNNHVEIVDKNGTNYNHFSYFIKIIPTTYVPLKGPSVTTYQYSASIYKKDIHSMMLGSNVSPGVYFKYEFSPIHMSIEQTRESFFTFFTSVLAIVGGIITVSHMLQSFVHRYTSILYKSD